ncbi:hypothetical protein PR048_007131 [Dryococelus australis]|uniref:DUF4371 domain-containing protein n=1 Tax=Dryococelus australis TaxID=614101 RepID=A0ABQ9ICS7_9NEOP|nr:hypothetical protein PR048_007131 [Dryococelus australis]
MQEARSCVPLCHGSQLVSHHSQPALLRSLAPLTSTVTNPASFPSAPLRTHPTCHPVGLRGLEWRDLCRITPCPRYRPNRRRTTQSAVSSYHRPQDDKAPTTKTSRPSSTVTSSDTSRKPDQRDSSCLNSAGAGDLPNGTTLRSFLCDETTNRKDECIFVAVFRIFLASDEHKMLVEGANVLNNANSTECSRAVVDILLKYEVKYENKCKNLSHIQCWAHKLNLAGNIWSNELVERLRWCSSTDERGNIITSSIYRSHQWALDPAKLFLTGSSQNTAFITAPNPTTRQAVINANAGDVNVLAILLSLKNDFQEYSCCVVKSVDTDTMEMLNAVFIQSLILIQLVCLRSLLKNGHKQL